jgi:hypothetical protein
MTETETQAAFAKRVGVTAGRISQLVRRGLPMRDGKVLIGEALAWMEATLDPSQVAAQRRPKGTSVQGAPRVTNRDPSPTPDDDDTATDTDEPADLHAAKLQHEIVKIARARHALAKDRGDVVARDVAERAIFERARQERDSLLGFCLRAAPVIAAEVGCDPGDLHRALDREVRAHLLALSDAPALPEAAANAA